MYLKLNLFQVCDRVLQLSRLATFRHRLERASICENMLEAIAILLGVDVCVKIKHSQRTSIHALISGAFGFLLMTISVSFHIH